MGSDPHPHFAGRVTAGMRGRGLTLRGLCREAGLDASFFSKVLAGKRSPPSDESMLRRIAEILGLDAVELIVSAGRIPAEWRALNDDPRLLQQVHALAAEGPAGDGAHRPLLADAGGIGNPAGAGRTDFRTAGARTRPIRPIAVTRREQPRVQPELPRSGGISEELL